MKHIQSMFDNNPVMRKALSDTAIPKIIDHTFNRNGRKWRVTSLVDTFVIGTAIDAQLDANGEPVRESDVLKVTL